MTHGVIDIDVYSSVLSTASAAGGEQEVGCLATLAVARVQFQSVQLWQLPGAFALSLVSKGGQELLLMIGGRACWLCVPLQPA